MVPKYSTILVSFSSLQKMSTSRCLSQKNVGVHGHTSKLYDELLADMILRTY